MSNEPPFVPFYRPYGMSEEEYAYEVRIAETKFAEWQMEQEMQKEIEKEMQKEIEGAKMKTIEELKKEALDELAYQSNGYSDDKDILFKAIDQAVEYASKEAVEKEQERIIGVIAEEKKKLVISPITTTSQTKWQMLEWLKNILSTPQSEKEPLTYVNGYSNRPLTDDEIALKKAIIEEEQRRIIGVIDEVARKIRDDKARYPMLDFENIRLSNLHDIKSALSTPQHEEV